MRKRSSSSSRSPSRSKRAARVPIPPRGPPPGTYPPLPPGLPNLPPPPPPPPRWLPNPPPPKTQQPRGYPPPPPPPPAPPQPPPSFSYPPPPPQFTFPNYVPNAPPVTQQPPRGPPAPYIHPFQGLPRSTFANIPRPPPPREPPPLPPPSVIPARGPRGVAPRVTTTIQPVQPVAPTVVVETEPAQPVVKVTMTEEDKRKLSDYIAKVVVSNLSPYFKKNWISSKGEFKHIARKITKEISTVEHVKNIDNEKTVEKIRNFVKVSMKRHRKQQKESQTKGSENGTIKEALPQISPIHASDSKVDIAKKTDTVGANKEADLSKISEGGEHQTPPISPIPSPLGEPTN